MSTRASGYERIEHDFYQTPDWVWQLLYSVEPWARTAWDCAPANPNFDFLSVGGVVPAICTNPPYGRLAEQFIRHALKLTASCA